MRLVQATPAVPHQLRISELRRRRRTTELDEGGIRAVSKIE